MTLEVRAGAADPGWGIVQSPFMRDHARTVSCFHAVTVRGNTLAYSETPVVDIHGRKAFEHTDRNTLMRG